MHSWSKLVLCCCCAHSMCLALHSMWTQAMHTRPIATLKRFGMHQWLNWLDWRLHQLICIKLYSFPLGMFLLIPKIITENCQRQVCLYNLLFQVHKFQNANNQKLFCFSGVVKSAELFGQCTLRINARNLWRLFLDPTAISCSAKFSVWLADTF